jgi:hypothetical protein
MADVEFKDNSIAVKNELESLAIAALEEAAGELESQVKRNTAVKTGQLKNSWQHRVESKGDEHTAVIGSPLQNALWEEFGTGEYALNGNGRKGGWFYKDEKGDGHFTHGKKPRRAFFRAYTEKKNRLIKLIQDKLKGGLSK